MGNDDQPTPSERRREARARAINLVSLGQLDDAGVQNDYVVGRTLDLSRDGVRLEVSHPIAKGSRVRLSLALGPSVLEVDGVVRSTVELDGEQHALGIEFDHRPASAEDGGTRAILDKYLAEHG
jgi:hypothetical protein